METLKKIFPLSFQAKDTAQLVIYCLIYIVAGTVLAFLIGILARIPFLGLLFTLISSLLEIYVTAGLIILFLSYFNVLK